MQTRTVSSVGLVLLIACSDATQPTAIPAPTVVMSAAGAATGAPAAQGSATPPAPGAAPSQPSATPAAGSSASTSGAPPVAAPNAGANTANAGASGPTLAAAGSGAMPPSTIPAPEPAGPPGLQEDSRTGEVVFRTEPIDLKAGDESYMCYAVTVPQNLVVDGFSKPAQKYVHHAQFVKTLLPEANGTFVCKEQFKLTWIPIFLAGNGASELRFDEGVGHVLPAGTQLMLQTHLFNTSDQPAKLSVEIRMHKSLSPNPMPVTPWAIGSGEIKVPPRQAGSAQNICTQSGPVEVVAVFPHMHQLGRKMTVEVGKSMDTMRSLYARDPFDFDDQHMEKMKFKLEASDLLRVTCDFSVNPGDQEVVWGESSTDEMCQFVGFALGDAPAQADCPHLWDKLLGI